MYLPLLDLFLFTSFQFHNFIVLYRIETVWQVFRNISLEKLQLFSVGKRHQVSRSFCYDIHLENERNIILLTR